MLYVYPVEKVSLIVQEKLKFTLEMEQNNSIHFLNLTINKTNNTHMYKIYRKPTTTDMVIHNLSLIHI